MQESLINYLALLGWSPGGERELYSLNELVDAFSLEAITKSGGRFDPERCKWFNQQYLQQADPSLIATVLEKEIKKNKAENKVVDLNRVVELIQNRLTLLTDIWAEACFFFIAPTAYDEKAVRKQWKAETTKILIDLIALIANTNDSSASGLNALIRGWANENNIGLGKIMAPLRIALVGSLRGPDVFEICSCIGVENSIYRINKILKHMSV